MARKCSSPGCAFTLPDKYPLEKCPWHLAPGKGPVKIAAAITIAAAGFGGGIAYKKFRAYLRNKEERKQRDADRKKAVSKPQEREATSTASKESTTKSKRRPRARKKTATRSKKKSTNESNT